MTILLTDPFTVGYGYDYAGRMRTMTNWSSFSLGNPAGARVTQWLYDGQRGWLTNKVYADGHGPAYAYTPAGRLASRTWVRVDGSLNPITTGYGYDAAGGLTNTLYSDTTPSVTNSYDRLGRLTRQSTTNYVLNSTYNLGGQLLTESWVGGPLAGLSVTNGYDALGRRTKLAGLKANSALMQQSFGYDAASRLATVSDGNNNLATYSYVANSPLVGQITYQHSGTGEMTTSKQYDFLNRLTQVSSQPAGTGAAPATFNYNYNSANQRTQDKLADGSYWVYGYDSLGQVTSGHKFFYDNTPVPGQQFDYSFDTIGNRTQTKAGGDQTGGNQRIANYAANSLNQITSRDYPGTNDVVGVALATNGVTVNGQAAWHKGEYFWGAVKTNNASAPQWQQVTVASGGGTSAGGLYVPQTREQLRYDGDGNLTNDGRWAYTWDAENRLVRITVNTNVGPQYQLTFAYDAKGRRIQKAVTVGGATTTSDFLYDGWNLMATLNPQASVLESFMWGSDLSGSMQGAGGVGGLLEVTYNGSVTTNCFVAFDGNGNVASLVNAANGTMVASYEYGPFGEVIRQTGPMAKVNPIRFSTKYQDDESDLLYYGYRYYKASTGTWVNRDPSEENGGVNLFAFVRNDPLSSIDPLGLMHVRYVVVRGSSLGMREFAGEWAQPYWAGDGNFLITSDYARSMVTINNNASWQDHFHFTPDYCNTVWSLYPEDPENVNESSGTIRVYAWPDESDGVPSCNSGGAGVNFTFILLYVVHLHGSGPAPTYATAYLFDGNHKPLLEPISATQNSPDVFYVNFVPITVSFTDYSERLVAIYQPQVFFLNRNAVLYGGTGAPSEGTAEGTIGIAGPFKQ